MSAAQPITPALLRREAVATIRLAGPLIGGQLAVMGMAFIDTVMAGSLSPRALAAVAVGASTWSAVNLFLIGVLMALPPFVSQLDGAGRRAETAALARQGLWVSQGVALVAVLAARNMLPVLEALAVEPEIRPAVTGYLDALSWGMPAWGAYLVLRFLSEGLGDTRPTLYFGIVGLAVNAAGNYLLMYGHLGLPALGVVGCGYATALVWWAQLAGMALWVARHRRFRDLRLFTRLEPPCAETIRELLRVGGPIGVALFIEGSLFALVALVIGSLGTEAVAGHQVAINFVAITFMVPLGLAMAVTVRVGRARGRGDPSAVRRAAAVGLGLAMLVQSVNAAILLSVPERVASIYTGDPRVIAIAVGLLELAALFQLSDGLQVAAAAALRGLADTRAPMLVTFVAYWLVGLPLGYALAIHAGLGARGMWIGLIAGLTLAGLLLAARLWRVTRDQRLVPAASG